MKMTKAMTATWTSWTPLPVDRCSRRDSPPPNRFTTITLSSNIWIAASQRRNADWNTGRFCTNRCVPFPWTHPILLDFNRAVRRSSTQTWKVCRLRGLAPSPPHVPIPPECLRKRLGPGRSLQGGHLESLWQGSRSRWQVVGYPPRPPKTLIIPLTENAHGSTLGHRRISPPSLRRADIVGTKPTHRISENDHVPAPICRTTGDRHNLHNRFRAF